MEYLALVRLRALIAQRAEVAQAEAQEVTLKKAIDEPASSAHETVNRSENAHRALIKGGKILAPPRVPVPDPPPVTKLIESESLQPPPPPNSTVSSCHLALVI